VLFYGLSASFTKAGAYCRKKRAVIRGFGTGVFLFIKIWGEGLPFYL